MRDHFDQIRRGQDMAQHFLEISEAIILSLDLKGRVRLLNKTGQRILGYSEQEIVGKNWVETIVPPEQRAEVLRDFNNLITSGTTSVMRFENEVLTKSGARIYVRWNDTLVRDEQGDVVAVLSSGIDLTEQKRAQDELRKSAAQLQDFNDASSDWLWEMGADLKISYVSPSLSRIIGIPAERLLGKTRQDIVRLDEMPPEQRTKWEAHLDDIQHHRSFRDFEYPYAKADGSVIHVRISGKPIFDDFGRFIGYRGTGCDITPEIEAQQRASRAQELLMHTIENVPTMMVLFDAQDRFVMCNQAYRQALPGIADLLVDGTSFEDISRISAERGLVAEYRDNPQGWVDHRMKRFRDPSEPVVHQQLDGRWVMTTDHRTPDGGTLIMRTDITPLKLAEEELQAKQAIIQSFIDAMEDPAAMIDLDANFILANKAMGDQFNVQPSALVGKPIFKTPPTEAGRRRRAWVDQVAATGLAIRQVDQHEGRWHNLSITPVFGPNAKVTQIAIVAQDITEDVQKDSLLRKMSQATEQSADLVLITDVHGYIEYVNRKFTETTGYTLEEAVGKTPRILASGNTSKKVYRDLWNTILSGNVWRGELKDRCKDGSFFWAAVTITPICDTDGNIVNFVSSHVDVTARKASEEALREAMLRTEIANRSKTELLANMSHELRTPLNAIIGFSDTMRHETFGPLSNPKYMEYAHDINSSGTHLLELVNDVLDVSAIEIGKLNLNEEVLNIVDVLSASTRLLAPRIQEGKILLTTDFADRSNNGLRLFADERRIKQIALNLLSNAAKFTDEGGEITVGLSLEKNGDLAIVFADTGIGMDAKEIAIAMTKFGQVDGGLARKHQGTGLGLPLTQKLVEAHNGKLIISSAKGIGTQVTIRFPRERVIIQ